MKDVNKECLEIAKLLWFENLINGKELPLGKLDYTEKSILFLNNFLLENSESISALNTDMYQKVVLRTGCYMGEVIRILFDGNFDWYSYDDLSNQNDDIKNLGKSIYTYYILSNKESINLFPLAKIDKLLQNGVSDDLVFYIKSIRENLEQIKD